MRNEELGMSNEFIEMRIIAAIKEILTGRVNDVLGNWNFLIPIFELADFKSMTSVVPMITLSDCERTEKERIIKQDAFSLIIDFIVPETQDSELFCYAYSTAVCKALGENPTLGGIADRVTVTGKKYVPPKITNCGMEWEVIISLRITVEGMNNAG